MKKENIPIMNWLLLVVGLCVGGLVVCEAGLPIRQLREIQESTQLRKDQIPVAVIELQEPETLVQTLQADTNIDSTDTDINTNTEIDRNLDTDIDVTETDILPAGSDGDIGENLRQVTENTPTSSTTPQNFVQFIQASPIGQFFSQLTGQPQQQQQQQQQQQNAESDEQSGQQTAPQPPLPNLPGFLNPATALTQAQQAVQNAAQSVVNTTSQAFQGLQQFASNIGNQLQSTLSNLGGQNQQSGNESTTRPPGPIQSLINNVVGVNQGADSATSSPTQQQPGGPLQGIISFFQGGNRPQQANNNPALPTNPANPANPANPTNPTTSNEPTKIEENNAVDDKLEGENLDIQPQESYINNEVRKSEEAVDESFEETPAEQLIVVNDDTNTAHEDTTT